MEQLGFMESVKHTLTNVFDFDSCSTRTEFWFFQLFRVICAGIMFLLTLVIANVGNENIPIWLALIIGIPIFLFILYIGLADIALCVRRLHDTDRTGLWYLILCIPYIGWAILLYLLCQPTDPYSGYRNDYELENGHLSIQTHDSVMEENNIIKEPNVVEDSYEWPIDNTGIFTNVFNLTGRIRRLEFFLVMLIGFAVLLILPFLLIIWRLALLAESIKRLHDIGLSGYWCIPALVAGIISIFAGIVSPWLLICCVIVFWVYVILMMLIPGTRGINEYGTNPKRSYREQTLEAGYPDI